MTSSSSSQQLIGLNDLFPENKSFDNKVFFNDTRGSELGACVIHTLKNAPLHVEGIFRIPIAPLLDQMRRFSGREDEADRCMEFIRGNLPSTHAAEIGRVGDDDANYIIIYPRANKPKDFRKSKTNVLTVTELVEVAIFSLENEIKPYQTVCGVKITRSNISTIRKIAMIIHKSLPTIKIAKFAHQYSSKQIDQIVSSFLEVKKVKERDEAIQVLKDKGFTEDQITRLFPS